MGEAKVYLEQTQFDYGSKSALDPETVSPSGVWFYNSVC